MRSNRRQQKWISSIAFMMIGGALLYLSCNDDGFNTAINNEVTLLQAIPIEIAIANSGNRNSLPGNGGTITTGAVTSTSIQLFWTRATDTVTPQADLEYRMYRSNTNNIGTPDDAENNGTVVAGWQKDMVTALAGSLTAGTIYYFNVVVRDGDSNRTAYITVAATTQSNAVYIFSAGAYDGMLTTPTTASARADIDQICINAKAAQYPEIPCMNVHAFISITGSMPGGTTVADDIAHMPTKYGVPTDKNIIGPSGIEIASKWSNLFNSTILQDLNSAGISQISWWSGSDSSGNYLAANICGGCNVISCPGWTSNSNIINGMTGASNKTDTTWITDKAQNCNTKNNVLCICW